MKEDKMLIITVLCIFLCILMALIGSYVDLLKFKQCYENDFRYISCKKYRKD